MYVTRCTYIHTLAYTHLHHQIDILLYGRTRSLIHDRMFSLNDRMCCLVKIECVLLYTGLTLLTFCGDTGGERLRLAIPALRCCSDSVFPDRIECVFLYDRIAVFSDMMFSYRMCSLINTTATDYTEVLQREYFSCRAYQSAR